MRRDGVELESLRKSTQNKYLEDEKREWKKLAAEKEASAQDAVEASAAMEARWKPFLLRPLVPQPEAGEAMAAASAPQAPINVRPTRDRKRAKPFGDGLESLGDKERRLHEAADAVCLPSRM